MMERQSNSFEKGDHVEKRVAINQHLDKAVEETDMSTKDNVGRRAFLRLLGVGVAAYVGYKVFVEPSRELREWGIASSEDTLTLYKRYLERHPEMPVSAIAVQNFEKNFREWSRRWNESHTRGYESPKVQHMLPAYKSYDWVTFAKKYDLISAPHPQPLTK